MENKLWQRLAAQVIYRSYPDSDLLAVGPPLIDEPVSEYADSASEAGDGLFAFLLHEADDEICLDEYLRRLNRAIEDIQMVKAGFRHLLLGGSLDELGDRGSKGATNNTDSRKQDRG